MACSSLVRGPLDDYVCDANEAVYFKMVSDPHELEQDLDVGTFHPEFSHQIFGETESIFGYKKLKIRIFYSASKLVRYINASWSEIVSNAREKSDVEPDDVLKIIEAKVGGTFLHSIDAFSEALQTEYNFKPHGELLHTFSISDHGDTRTAKRTFEVYHCDMTINGFREYHERMETFLLWFIDAASYIDVDDDKWDFFVIHEKTGSPSASGTENCNGTSSHYKFVGFMTTYRYYAYPEKIRPRISQVFVLPPFQKQGIGVQLLQTVYNYYIAQSKVLDITVEDPSENFTRLRDFVDCRNCMKLACFQADVLKKAWNEQIAKDAQEILKLSKKQARRVFEILKLRITNRSDKEAFRNYRLEVKKRLNAPFKKMRKGNAPADEGDAYTIREMRHEELALLFEQLMEEYEHVIERLATYG